MAITVSQEPGISFQQLQAHPTPKKKEKSGIHFTALQKSTKSTNLFWEKMGHILKKGNGGEAA
ncbi:hypothetical protein ACFOQM_10590 [Paenibacillus sp. GCM10012307]|uniref:Uncharacterized protein n=1 Tax=Paenibacillus roseus TaxID=2798579 RepID=A0A934MV49_9BACL|nr:hypothetical protein [Paenibacillus roseus]MBJ6361737.1 hypothetical protein [Paenibacillus roseus]